MPRAKSCTTSDETASRGCHSGRTIKNLVRRQASSRHGDAAEPCQSARTHASYPCYISYGYSHMIHVFVYAATIFISSVHLFLVQPIIAKQFLPWFGGTASVWTTCLFFFQFVLLLGYCYAHALVRLPARVQPVIHGALLAASLALLPIVASLGEKSVGTQPA